MRDLQWCYRILSTNAAALSATVNKSHARFIDTASIANASSKNEIKIICLKYDKGKQTLPSALRAGACAERSRSMANLQKL